MCCEGAFLGDVPLKGEGEGCLLKWDDPFNQPGRLFILDPPLKHVALHRPNPEAPAIRCQCLRYCVGILTCLRISDHMFASACLTNTAYRFAPAHADSRRLTSIRAGSRRFAPVGTSQTDSHQLAPIHAGSSLLVAVLSECSWVVKLTTLTQANTVSQLC